jgi:hypothetical protein
MSRRPGRPGESSSGGPQVGVPCPWCSSFAPRIHQLKCDKRPVKCDQCGEDLTAASLQPHRGLCSKRSVACPGCRTHVVAADLSDHLRHACPSTQFQCPECNAIFNNAEDYILHSFPMCTRSYVVCQLCHKLVSAKTIAQHYATCARDTIRAQERAAATHRVRVRNAKPKVSTGATKPPAKTQHHEDPHQAHNSSSGAASNSSQVSPWETSGNGGEPVLGKFTPSPSKADSRAGGRSPTPNRLEESRTRTRSPLRATYRDSLSPRGSSGLHTSPLRHPSPTPGAKRSVSPFDEHSSRDSVPQTVPAEVTAKNALSQKKEPDIRHTRGGAYQRSVTPVSLSRLPSRPNDHKKEDTPPVKPKQADASPPHPVQPELSPHQRSSSVASSSRNSTPYRRCLSKEASRVAPNTIVEPTTGRTLSSLPAAEQELIRKDIELARRSTAIRRTVSPTPRSVMTSRQNHLAASSTTPPAPISADTSLNRIDSSDHQGSAILERLEAAITRVPTVGTSPRRANVRPPSPRTRGEAADKPAPSPEPSSPTGREPPELDRTTAGGNDGNHQTNADEAAVPPSASNDGLRSEDTFSFGNNSIAIIPSLAICLAEPDGQDG